MPCSVVQCSEVCGEMRPGKVSVMVNKVEVEARQLAMRRNVAWDKVENSGGLG